MWLRQAALVNCRNASRFPVNAEHDWLRLAWQIRSTQRSLNALDAHVGRVLYFRHEFLSSVPLAMETPRRLGSLHGESTPIVYNHWLTAPYRTSSTSAPLRLDSSFSRTQIIWTTSPPLDDDAEKNRCASLATTYCPVSPFGNETMNRAVTLLRNRVASGKIAIALLVAGFVVLSFPWFCAGQGAGQVKLVNSCKYSLYLLIQLARRLVLCPRVAKNQSPFHLSINAVRTESLPTPTWPTASAPIATDGPTSADLPAPHNAQAGCGRAATQSTQPIAIPT